jgi:hypothetical protein
MELQGIKLIKYIRNYKNMIAEIHQFVPDLTCPLNNLLLLSYEVETVIISFFQ